ncbi:hypothetical protein KIPB_011914, partial [Kipferlia bialata]|eukprot:g11914.t1
MAQVVERHYGDYNTSAQQFQTSIEALQRAKISALQLKTMIADIRSTIVKNAIYVRQRYREQLVTEHKLAILKEMVILKDSPRQIEALIEAGSLLSACAMLLEHEGVLAGLCTTPNLTALLTPLGAPLSQLRQTLLDRLVSEIFAVLVLQRTRPWLVAAAPVPPSVLASLTPAEDMDTRGPDPEAEAQDNTMGIGEGVISQLQDPMLQGVSCSAPVSDDSSQAEESDALGPHPTQARGTLCRTPTLESIKATARGVAEAISAWEALSSHKHVHVRGMPVSQPSPVSHERYLTALVSAVNDLGD